jgi:hypothetical protein
MSRYLRIRHHGATCFFTVNLFNRTDTLLVDHIDLLRTAIRPDKPAISHRRMGGPAGPYALHLDASSGRQ